MRIYIDTQNISANNGDILVYQNGQYVAMSKFEYLASQDRVIYEQGKKIEELEKEIQSFEENVNKKLNLIAKDLKILLGE